MFLFNGLNVITRLLRMNIHVENRSLTELFVRTAHYTFKVLVKDSKSGISFTIGDKPPHCLELYVPIPERVDERLKHTCFTAILHKIEGLVRCSLQNIGDDYLEKYSMGTEILDFVNFLLIEKYPHITSVSLHDTSQMPCNREYADELDLLTYSISVNGFTWYELKLNAYIPNNAYKSYRKEVKAYCSKERKSSYDFDTIFKAVVESGNVFAIELFYTEIVKNIFNNTQTFPDFFKCLGKIVERKDKCKLFKLWLARFISSQVTIVRDWKYDLTKCKT